MQSSSGQYFIALDHIRALAALMVFCWHFTRTGVFTGYWVEVPEPWFPLSVFSEGHVGVSLFMALSGYLFAKLLSGQRIDYRQFLWNRFFRLAPLLLFLIVIVGVLEVGKGRDLLEYTQTMLSGFVLPTWPRGGWSITVEIHFYFLLPFLLALSRRWRFSLLLALLLAIAARALYFSQVGEVHILAYNTIVGRIDQFLLGILAFQHRQWIVRHWLAALTVLLGFLLFYRFYDSVGGFSYGGYPSTSLLWVFIPAIEGLAFAVLIALYDNGMNHSHGPISRGVAEFGKYSYSIYLLHSFFVFEWFQWIDQNLIALDNINLALLFALLCYGLMFPIAWLSYRLIEQPFMRLRKSYLSRLQS